MPPSMSSANMSLEELEARCETLQRRVQDRGTAGSAMRSPPRPYSGAARASSPVRLRGSTPPSGFSAASAVAPPLSPPPVRALPTQAAATVDEVLSPSEVARAIQALEAERGRLEDQLLQIRTHLRAYRQLQSVQYQQAAPAAMQLFTNPYLQPTLAASTPATAAHDVRSEDPLPTHANRSAHLSPTRHRSPRHTPAQGTTTTLETSSAVGGRTSAPSLKTEEIYRELDAIRKAREEREAQRRVAMQAAATPQRN